MARGTQQKKDRERGVALVSAILLVMTLSFVAATVLVLSTTEMKIAANYRTGTQAFYNAEAGVNYVLGQVRNNFLASGITAVNLNLHYPPPAGYPLLSGGKLPFSTWTAVQLQPRGNNLDYRFIATGYHDGSSSSIRADIRIPTVPKGIFASTSVDFQNNLSMSSDSEVGSNIYVKSGNSTPPMVVLGPFGTYDGKGTPATTTTTYTIAEDPLGCAGLVSGASIFNDNATAYSKTPPIGIIGNTLFGNVTIRPGRYYVTSLSLNSLTINPPGAVTIYYHGTGAGTINMSGASINTGGSSNLAIISDTDDTFNFQSGGGGGTFNMTIYAPKAAVVFKNNTDFTGMIWAKSIEAQNNFDFHYDPATAPTFAPTIRSWKLL